MGWIVIAVAAAIIIGNVYLLFKRPIFILIIWAAMAILVALFWDDFQVLFDFALHVIQGLWEA